MTSTIVFAKDPFSSDSWQHVETNDVLATLEERLGKWPENARLYFGDVSQDNDITPGTVDDIERIGVLEGTFFVVEYPEDPVSIIIAVVIAVAAAYVLTANIPKPQTQRSDTATSPNNELSARTNSARLNGRIPDIYGLVRSTPDLIALPYSTFESNNEVEYAYMCVGRGSYDIWDIRDGTTPLSEIAGARCNVYGPNTSPNSGAVQLNIGGPIGEPVRSAVKCTSVNGQTLMWPGVVDLNLASGQFFIRPIDVGGGVTQLGFTTKKVTTVNYGPDVPYPFPDYFAAGDSITITNSNIFWAGTGQTHVNGTYTVSTVTADYVTFVNPVAVNANWNNVYVGGYGFIYEYYSGVQNNVHLNSRSVDAIVGYFTNTETDTNTIFCNLVASNGLYRDDGTTQTALSIAIRFEVRQLNSSGVETGWNIQQDVTLTGSTSNKDQVALTAKISLPFVGRCKIKAWRLTAKQTGTGTSVQDVKWRDLYFMAPVAQSHFGDVTTIQVVTRATTGALAVKERKLNCFAYRKIPTRVTGTTFTSAQTSLHAGDIFTAIATDAKLGNRQLSELDLDNIYTALNQVQAYFGTGYAIQFSYTFDKANMSAEEMLAVVANAVFCVAYRRGNLLRFSFEQDTANSRLLFNHRNKIPGSESRTYTFGPSNEYDGIELEYANPDDYDAPISKFIPVDRSASKTQKIELPGVRSHLQAYFHAWRAYQKLIYARTSIEFDATQEADLLLRNDRILVTNSTKSPQMEGEVLSQNVLVLTLSQQLPTTLSSMGYVIFLQLPDGTVDPIPCTPTAGGRTVTLSRAPTTALTLAEDASARCTYILTAQDTSEFFWDTTASFSGWTITGGTLADTTEGKQITSSGTDPIFRSPDQLNFFGGNYPRVKARIRRTAGSGWDGKLFYLVSGGHGESSSYYAQAIGSSPVLNTWTVVEWDMHNLTVGGTDWKTSFIRQLRFDFGATSSDVFNIDWIMLTTSLNEPFLVTEITPSAGLVAKVSAINYDRRYYLHDQDFKNGVVT